MTQDNFWDQYSIQIIAGIAAMIVIALASIIVLQRRKISELERPKYGFLNKPLAAIMFLILSVSVGGGIYYLNTADQTARDIAAEKVITVEIKYFESAEDTYVLEAIPQVNSEDWGNDPQIITDIYWTVKNGDQVNNYFEFARSMSKKSNLEVVLPDGTNLVKATVFLDSKAYYQEIEIENL